MIFGLKIDAIKPILLISMVGPNTKKANKEPLVKVAAKERAKKNLRWNK